MLSILLISLQFSHQSIKHKIKLLSIPELHTRILPRKWFYVYLYKYKLSPLAVKENQSNLSEIYSTQKQFPIKIIHYFLIYTYLKCSPMTCYIHYLST